MRNLEKMSSFRVQAHSGNSSSKNFNIIQMGDLSVNSDYEMHCVFQLNAVFSLINWFAFIIRSFLARIKWRTRAVVAILLRNLYSHLLLGK